MGLGTYVTDLVEGFSSVWDAMVVGLQGYTDKPVTELYPDTKMRLPERTRMQLFNRFEDCIGCNMCAMACPVDCIYIDFVKAPKAEGMPEQYLGKTRDGKEKKLYVTKFDIDMAKCCYCNLCTFPCPTECLTMSPRFEASVTNRQDLIYRFSPMTKDEIERVTKAAEVERIATEAAKAAAAAAKAAAAAAAPKPETPPAPAAPAPGPEPTKP
ncbi:MAG: NADH-quinone oxidoreductase subunit [Planctomycetota bacterium]|nr:MAG: NADH-quinone oxidoreductase subunit [Planctomycetota bacterium]